MLPIESPGVSSPESATAGGALPALVVFSRTRWGFPYQRVQHLTSGLARDFQVFFIEEPAWHDAAPVLAIRRPAAGVEVLTPRTRVRAPGFHADQHPALQSLLADFVAERRIVDPVVWVDTPEAWTLVADLEPSAVVYDGAADPVAQAPEAARREIRQQEAALLALADIVLSGGPSRHAVLSVHHPDVRCVPNAVDAAHFAPDRLRPHGLESAAARALHEGLAHPRLGYFGVIDERLDFELLAAIADQRADWQLVMVGPVAGIDPQALPRRDNIHWLGMKSYDLLPCMQSHWDVCLLPFVVVPATRCLNPAKTLEYLAGGKPVVSTALPDVASLYGHVVRTATDAPGFVAAVESVLGDNAAQRAQRQRAARELVAASGWDTRMAPLREMMTTFVRPAARCTPATVTALEPLPDGRWLPVVQSAPIDLVVGAAAMPRPLQERPLAA